MSAQVMSPGHMAGKRESAVARPPHVMIGRRITMCSRLIALALLLGLANLSAANAQIGAHMSPVERKVFRATVGRGCSEQWARLAAHAAGEPPVEGRLWLKMLASDRVKESIRYIRTMSTPEEEEKYAREILADYRCGAVPGDVSDVTALMSELADALERENKLSEAELVRRNAVAELRHAPSSDEYRLAAALTALASTLEKESKFGAAEDARDEALKLNRAPPSSAVARYERMTSNGIDLPMMIQTRVDPFIALGDLSIAESFARQVLALADSRSVPDDEITATILLKLGNILDKEHEYGAAEAYLERVERVHFDSRPTKAAFEYAVEEEEIGRLMGMGNYGTAGSLALMHLSRARSSGDEVRWITANLLMGELLLEEEQWTKAEPYLRTAIRAANHPNVPEDLYCNVAYELSVALNFRGRFNEAGHYLQEVLRNDAKRAGISKGALPGAFYSNSTNALIFDTNSAALTDYGTDLITWGSTLTGMRQWAKADEALALARRILSRQMDIGHLLDPDSHEVGLRHDLALADGYSLGALWEMERTRPGGSAADLNVLGSAFEMAQTADLSSAADALARSAAKLAAGIDGLRDEVRKRSALESTILQLNGAEMSLGGQQGNSSFEKRIRVERRLGAALGQLDGVTNEISARFPQFWSLINPPPVSVAQLTGADGLLRHGEVLILITQGDFGVFVFAISRDGVAWYRCGLTPGQLNQLVERVRCSIGLSACGDDEYLRPVFDSDAAYELYQALFGNPAISRVVASSHEILFSANGALTSLPLGVLITRPPGDRAQNATTLRNEAWLIRSKAIEVLPSVATLRIMRQSLGSDQEAAEPFLGFAPSYGMHHVGHGSEPGAESVIGALEALPDTGGRTEVQALRTYLGAGPNSVYLGGEATRQEVMKLDAQGRLGSARIIDFSTHAILSEPHGVSEPALVMTLPLAAEATHSYLNDTLLRASDIVGLHLHASWVILSGCDTGAGDTPEAEGLSGLARAFFYAGAKSLLVSNWSVGADAGIFLVTRTFAHIRTNGALSRADALRLAELDLMNDTGRDSTPLPDSSPAAWAPFEVVGAD